MSLPVWPNGWVFIYELSGSGFESSYSQLTLNFKDWTFGFIVTRHFRPKSVCLNKRGYCRPIARILKMIYIHWGVGQFSTTYYFWVMEVTGFWIKKRHKYKIYFPQNTKVSTMSREYRKAQFWIQWLYNYDKMYLTKAASKNLSI